MTGDLSREQKRSFAWAPSKSLLSSIRPYRCSRASRWPWDSTRGSQGVRARAIMEAAHALSRTG